MSITKVPVGAIMPNNSQQLLIQRDITRRTGMLHEIQALNLRVWPRGFLAVKSSIATYDHKNLKVTFEVGDSDGEQPAAFKTRLRYLDAAVKFLLGTDVVVVVKRGEANLYEGAALSESEWLLLTSAPLRKKSTKIGKKAKASRR